MDGVNNELQSVRTRDERHIEWEDESSGGGGVGASEWKDATDTHRLDTRAMNERCACIYTMYTIYTLRLRLRCAYNRSTSIPSLSTRMHTEACACDARVCVCVCVCVSVCAHVGSACVHLRVCA